MTFDMNLKNHANFMFQIVIGVGLPHPFGLIVYEDSIFWTDWNTKSVQMASKFNGTNHQTLKKGLDNVMDITVFHRGRPYCKYFGLTFAFG